MNPRVFVPTERELRIASALRRQAIEEVESISDVNRVANLLDAPPTGVKSLIARQTWDLQTAFRVAEALGLSVGKAMEEAALDMARD